MLLAADLGDQRGPWDLQRIGQPGRQSIEDAVHVDATFTRKPALETCRVDETFVGGGYSGWRVADMHEMEPLGGYLTKVGDARPGTGEVQQVNQDSGVGLIGSAYDTDRLAEVRRLRPRWKLKVDGESERSCQFAQPRELVDLPRAVGVGKLGDDVTRPEFRTGIEEALEIAGVVVRADPGKLNVENLDPVRGQPDLGGPHQGRIGGERVVRLLRRDTGQPQAHVPVAGLGRGIHQFRRG